MPSFVRVRPRSSVSSSPGGCGADVVAQVGCGHGGPPLRRALHITTLGVLLVLAVWLAGAAPAAAQGPDNRVGLVVQFGNGTVFSQCYAYTEGMTGLELLRRAGISAAIEYSSMGALVCRMSAPQLGADGCEYPREDCLCQARSLPWRYWAYWHLQGNDWMYSDRGAVGRQLQPGSVDGWAWGVGTTDFGAKPPRLTFNDVCAPPTATPPPPPPTGTPGPQPLGPTSTFTPLPTATTPPTATVAPTATTAPTATSTTTANSEMTATAPPAATAVPVASSAADATSTPTAAPVPVSRVAGSVVPTAAPMSPTALPAATPAARPGAAASGGTSTTPATAAVVTPRPGNTPAVALAATAALATTPTAARVASVVDLSHLTPEAASAAIVGERSGPPIGYAVFALIVLGLVGALVVRQRRGL